MGISSSQSFNTKPTTFETRSLQNANFPGLFSPYNLLDGFPIFLRVTWWSDLGRVFQANWTEHNNKKPLPGRGLAGGVEPERKRGGSINGRVGGRDGWAGDQQGRPRPPSQGQGP